MPFLRCSARYLFALFTLFAGPLKAQLGPFSYQSLQTQVHNSERVVVGRITSIGKERAQLGQTTYQINYTTEEVIKGGAPELSYFYLFAEREQIDVWIRNRTRLVFGSPYQTYGNSESAGVMLDLSLKKYLALSLGEGGKLEVLRKKEEILEAIRRSAERLPGVVRMRTFQLSAPQKLVEEERLIVQDGSPVIFVVVDDPLESWAKKRIQEGAGYETEQGAHALKNFKSKENVAWVHDMLAAKTTAREREALEELLGVWERLNVPR